MLLQSQLFKGDPQLERCAQSNEGRILPGAKGEHVGKIQLALGKVDEARIDVGEIANKTYGSSTATAVLNYKQVRNIINPSYQTQADNIVGIMTVARLDFDVDQLERKEGGKDHNNVITLPEITIEGVPEPQPIVRTSVSSNWGAVGLTTFSAEMGLGERVSVYAFLNRETKERWVYLLATLGIGFSLPALKIPKMVTQLAKATLNSKNLLDEKTYTAIAVNRPFSFDDLHLAQAAEFTAGIAGGPIETGVTFISAWPFFQGAPKPGAIVNNDLFTGCKVSSGEAFTLGVGLKAAYHFKGIWIRLFIF